MVKSISFMVRFVMVYAFLGIFSGVVSAESVRLSGRVVDAQGKGLKDAYVFLYEIISDQSGLCVARDLTQKTKSDADGNFSFVQDKKPVAGREAVVLAAMEGQSIRWAAWDMMMDKEVVLALGEYGTISGIVQDIEGRPLGNAPVRALLKIASPEPGNRIYCFDRLTKTTDASGRFSFDFIPKDAVAEFYVESAGKISFYGAVRNFSELPFQYKPGDRDVLISVCDESGVSGTVIGPDMKPVAGVELLVSGMFTVGPAGQTATTDANGKFQVNHLGSGLYSIYLSHSEVNASWASAPVNVLLGKGEKNEAITLRVTKAGEITFIIQDAQSGTEISNCSVWLMRQGERFDNGLFSSWRSENEDSLTYKVLAGDYIYKIYAEGYRTYSDNKPIKVLEGESVSITAKLESCPQIKGVVRDSKGGSVDQARVLIFPGGSRAITNSNGEFQAYFDDEQAEDEVWVYCEDSLQQSAAIQPVSKDKPSVSIQLKKTLPLRGRVVNEKAKGVADASIGLYLIDSQNQSHLLRSNCVTDQFGNYSNLGVVPGYRYQIMVHGRSQRAASPVFEAPLGSFSMQLDSITLGITRITGQVVDEQSRSIDGASVFLYDVIKSDQDDSGFEVKLAGESVSDSAGQYSIELQGEREGIDHSFVMVSKQDYAIGIELYSPDKPNIKPVVLSSGPKTFSGVIKDSAGNPLSGVSVSVYVSEYQKNYSDSAYYYDIAKEAAQTELLKTVTGQDGVFVISHIPPYAKGEFMIRGEGYAPLYTGKSSFRQEEMTIPAGRAGLAYVLQRLSDVYGVVVDQETGKPIIGEKVFVTRIEQGMVAMKAWSSMTGTHALKTEKEDNDELITDEKGCFRSGNLAPGRYRVTLDTFSASTRQWSAGPQDIEVGEGQSVEVKVPAVRLGTITVSVIDSQRQTPVSGAMVYIVPENAESNAGENTSSTVIPLNTITFVPANGSLEEDGQVLTQLDYGSSKETVIPVKTDEQGKAVFCVAPGTYSVNKVVKQSYEYTAGSERIEVTSKGRHEITVKMTALPGICGVCRNSAGQPVPSAEIRELGCLEILAVTDGQGWFQFDPVALKDPGSPTGIILVASQSQLQLGGCGKVVSNKTNTLELKPAVLVYGQLVEPAGNSVPEALIHVFSTEQYITSGSERRPETKLAPYTEVHTDLFGKFSLLAIPDLSYVIQIAVEGYGVVEETIVNIAKSSYRNNKYPDDQDYFIDKTIIRSDGPDQAISSKIWRFRSGKDRMDLGLIHLPALDQTLSGIVVDRMGNPLKGYKITIEGKGQPANKTCVSDQSGRFQLDGLCHGLVDVSATNGTYRIFSKWVQVGGTLRLVSADHPVQQAAQADESLGTVDISVIDADTKKPVQGEKLSVQITPEQGKDINLKPDEQGNFKARLPEGLYKINATNYPLCETSEIKVEVKAGQGINVVIPMKRNTPVKGIIHLPESVSSDEIEMQVEPQILKVVHNLDIAGDGQFSCLLEFTHVFDTKDPSCVWFWVWTKDKKYIAVVKHPVKEQNIDITLEPEAIIKIKGKGVYFYTCRWEQQEIVKEVGLSSSFHGQKDTDDYYVIRGLAAKKEGLKYIIGSTKGEIVVDSKELEPGKTKIIEIP